MSPPLSTPQLSDELKRHLTRTLSENYGQPGASEITTSVDRLQQDVSLPGHDGHADMASCPDSVPFYLCGLGQVIYLLSTSVFLGYVSIKMCT